MIWLFAEGSVIVRKRFYARVRVKGGNFDFWRMLKIYQTRFFPDQLLIKKGITMDNVTLLGILLTVFFGVIGIIVGVRAVKKKAQSQVVKDSQVAIQSGRDTKIRTK